MLLKVKDNILTAPCDTWLNARTVMLLRDHSGPPFLSSSSYISVIASRFALGCFIIEAFYTSHVDEGVAATVDDVISVAH